jgi:catechol 2,3-dioxygenase-like lactoylglutathione lyase family enzyme
MATMTVAERPSALDIKGIAYLAVEVVDLDRAVDFYGRVLGLELIGRDMLPFCGPHAALMTATGQWVVLTPNPARADLSETGVHQGYRVSAAARAAITRTLLAEAFEIKTYREDRPAEAKDNFYFFDPDGNRLQLVTVKDAASPTAISGIDHAAVQTADMMWAEAFYAEELGLPVDHRVGWNTADYVRARKWAAGEEDMAPGTRRLDQRYTVMVNRKTVPRANMQLYVRTGSGVLGVYLANKHFQEPPEEQLAGAPRIALAVTSRDRLDGAARLLASHRRSFEGPVIHPQSVPLVEASLYFKDSGGNFLELCVARKGAS